MDNQSLAALLRHHNVDGRSLSRFCVTPVGAIYKLTTTGADALDTWRALRSFVASAGYRPVVSPPLATLGYDGSAIRDLIAYLESDAVIRVIANAEHIDSVAWLQARLAADIESAAEDGDDPEGYRDELTGVWPAEVEPHTSFAVTAAATVELHLVPTTIPWHVPAFYRYGGTGTPTPEEHVALLKYWSDGYGAEMLGFGGDLIEMYVGRPPQSQTEALALAWEHYGYCPDAVLQGAGTVAALAATLLRSIAWHFWWD